MSICNLTATHINYYNVCHRKLWLFANGIQMEHNSEIVAEGKLIAETTYLDRNRKYTELAIDGIKIDFYDAKNKVVHEVKKSDKVENAHIAQVKYYLYILQQHGVDGASGIIEYPKLKQRQKVQLTDRDVEEVKRWELETEKIIGLENCPPVINAKICKSCSYFEFCYINEEK